MKYKLLKDTPTHKAGTIFVKKDSNNYYPEECLDDNHGWHESDLIRYYNVQDNPEWFEPVEEFKKEFEVTAFAYADDSFWLHEKIGTEEQAKAKKELMEHIYKFEEPSIASNFKQILAESFADESGYGHIDDIIGFQSGTIMNDNSTEQDREERILLLNNYINSLKS